MADVKGRGAFTKVGKNNGRSFYEYHRGEPWDGGAPEESFNHEAVHLGVLSIENRLVQLGYDVVADGKFGPKTKRAVKQFQRDNGLTVSGTVGYTTGPLLFSDVIAGVGESYNFDPAYIYGIMKGESGGDPGAVGYDTPGDRGLYQYNTLVHDITYEQAHDFDWATEAVFTRFQRAWKRYAGKGSDLRVSCSIAQHNAPAWADSWFANEEPPNDTIARYVSRIKGFALTY